jgi:hypothetical protein
MEPLDIPKEMTSMETGSGSSACSEGAGPTQIMGFQGKDLGDEE